VALYGLVILTILGLVSAQFLADNPGMRFIPLYAACFTKLSALPFLAKLISVSAVLALLTTMLVVLVLTSRVLNAAAQEGILPPFFARTAQNGSPIPASALMCLLSAGVACFPQFTQEIVSLGALTTVIGNGIQCVSLISARKKFPAPEGGFRISWGSALGTAILGIFVLCYIPGIVQGGWQIWAYTAGLYAAGLVIFLFRRKQ
jgi:amino acid transporter